MKITQEDVTALERAISAKWEPLLLTKDEDVYDAIRDAGMADNCPCCLLGRVRNYANGSERGVCAFCAISDFTGRDGCRETPLDYLRERVAMSSSKHSTFLLVVREEIEFLNRVLDYCKAKLPANRG